MFEPCEFFRLLIKYLIYKYQFFMNTIECIVFNKYILLMKTEKEVRILFICGRD